MIRILANWGPATLWAAALFYLSSRTFGSGPSLIPVSDKVVHVGLYAVLGGTLAWGRERSAPSPGHGVLLSMGLLYALSDEYHQSFVPGRTADPADWLADAVGLLLGYAGALRFWGTRESSMTTHS